MLTTTKSKQELISEIKNALDSVDFGSVEIYVQDKTVTQITVRNIKKTSINMQEEQQVLPGNQIGNDKVFTISARFRRSE